MPKFLKEACVESLHEAVLAFNQGADQLELCANLDLDGLTPNVTLINSVLKEVSIPVKIMLRNRAGDFFYSTQDVIELKSQLQEINSLNIAGIVFGALNQNHTLDINLIKTVCALAPNIPFTIHKCIDLVKDYKSAIEKLKKSSNVKFILSSGGTPTAIDGKDRLLDMIKMASPEIDIIPAGKVTSKNLRDLDSILQARIYHGRQIV